MSKNHEWEEIEGEAGLHRLSVCLDCGAELAENFIDNTRVITKRGVLASEDCVGWLPEPDDDDDPTNDMSMDDLAYHFS